MCIVLFFFRFFKDIAWSDMFVAGYSVTWIGIVATVVKIEKCETGADLLFFFF